MQIHNLGFSRIGRKRQLKRALEAYWRSVAWPAQGVFVGEPLAAPFGR